MTRPNILIFMVDQLETARSFPMGPPTGYTPPHAEGAGPAFRAFRQRLQTASPLCAPGRASFMSGRLPSRTRVYDNAAEFASDIPTFAHHLRRAGYRTCLSGKMHFVGPDQLHGFEERLTTDIYPADFGWTHRLSQAGGTDRLVVSQHGERDRRGRGRDHQPVGITTTRSPSTVSRSFTIWRAAGMPGPGA